MNLKSIRAILSILTGIIVGLLISIFLKPVCWGPLVGIFVAALLANVSSPQEGGIVGAIVIVPIGIYAFMQIPAGAFSKTIFGLIGNILGLFLGLGFVAMVGALYGMIIGKLFDVIRNRKTTA